MIPSVKLITGQDMPMLGLGTWQLTGKACTQAVKAALKLGYTHIDTAEMYHNEAEIGEALKGHDRKKLFITSKLWPHGANYESALKSCEQSISKLGCDYLDLYLVHWPNRPVHKELFMALKHLLDDGRVKAVGVSNFTVNHLKDEMKLAKDMGFPLAVNQVEFHPMLYQEKLMEFCHKNQMVVTAYSPLARGMVLENHTVNQLALKYSKTPSQISLMWLLSKGIVVIPKASSENHLAENLALFDAKLSSEDIKLIDELNENKRLVNPDFGEFDY